MSLSATDAAFEGFRLARRAPAAIAVWAVAWFMATLVSGAIMVSIAGPAAGELMAAPFGASPPDAERAQALLARVAPALMVMAAWSLVFNAVFLSAVARAVLRPEARAFGYLRLGAAELVQLGNLLLWSAVVLVAYLAVLLVASVLAAVAQTVGGAGAGGLLVFVAAAAGAALMVWLAARLSLAGAVVVATGRVGVPGSWALSAGHVRPLVIATLLALLLSVAVTVLVMMVFAPLTALLGGPAEPGAPPPAPDTSSLAAWFTPAMLSGAAASAVAYALTGAILGGYGARAYALLTEADRMNAKS